MKLFSGKVSSVSRRHSFGSTRRTPDVKNKRHLIDREVRTVSPDFERARMAFTFGGSGPSAFGSSVGGSSAFGSNAGGSNSQTQTGPDLEEIQTEVDIYQSVKVA